MFSKANSITHTSLFENVLLPSYCTIKMDKNPEISSMKLQLYLNFLDYVVPFPKYSLICELIYGLYIIVQYICVKIEPRLEAKPFSNNVINFRNQLLGKTKSSVTSRN